MSIVREMRVQVRDIQCIIYTVYYTATATTKIIIQVYADRSDAMVNI